MANLTAGEFIAWLDRWNLTDGNAALVFNVSYSTIKYWTRSGVTGAAAQIITFMDREGIQPHYLAERCGARLSMFQRSQYERKGKPKRDRVVPMPEPWGGPPWGADAMPAKGKGDAAGIPTTTEPPAGSRWPKRDGNR